MARPSEYDPKVDYLKLADEYISTCGRLQTKLPKISEFCREYIGKSEDCVMQWIEDETRVELIGSIKKVRESQKEQLMDDGLYGGKEVNNAMAIFLLKANHGMIETDRTELTGKDGTPLGVVVLPEQYATTTNNMDSTPRASDGSSEKN